MQEHWKDTLRRGIRHQAGHVIIDLDYLGSHLAGYGARLFLAQLGDVRTLRRHGPPRIRAFLAWLDDLAAKAPDVCVSGSTSVPPSGEAFNMPGGKFGTTFGQDGIIGTPWQAWIGTANPGLVANPAVLPNVVQPQLHVIVLPELEFWAWVQTWLSDVSTVWDAASGGAYAPTLRQRFWAAVWPNKACRDFLRDHPECGAAAQVEHQRANASWPGRVRPREVRS